ncbi:MAG: HD-GYP domain-containing protein [Leptolyngbya sp. PLA3]|nr:MAG: HD-GYP domain-containing protein [Cyanobacteria bacterium CYA]MCE7968047.1 HD-GYP domain-containing protein [Leptolyngbya sp. PL-A3]
MDAILQEAFSRFSEACGRLGAPAWRVDHVRREARSPGEGALRHFAENPEVIERVAAIACRFDESPEGVVVAPLTPGTWLILIREQVRSRRYSWACTVAATPGALASGELCAVHPDLEPLAGDLACALHRASVADFTQAEARASLLADLHCQCVLGSLDGHSIEEFTDQLAQSYESSTLLFRVGRRMGDIAAAGEFIESVLTDLFESTEFAWCAMLRLPDEYLDRAGVPECCLRFDADRFSNQAIETAARMILRTGRLSQEPAIIEHPPGMPEQLGPEVVTVALGDESRPIGMIALGARTGREWAVSSHDTLPVQAVAASVTAYLRIARLYRLLHESFLGTLGAFSAALDAKDRYTQGHSERVATVGRMIAQAASLDRAMCESIYIAGLVHDIGKIGVPEALLCSTGKMTDAEFAIMKSHPEIGERILRGVPLLADALPGVLHHHERWDGNGYPARLSGESIPLMARVLAIADTFDAMSSTRTYRVGQDRQCVLDEIRRCSGKQFDPRLVEVFLELDLSEYDRMLVEAEQAQAARSRAA